LLAVAFKGVEACSGCPADVEPDRVWDATGASAL
jgi:hypothetical protein